MNRIVLAGTHSGCGKTTVSLGIMAALTKRGKKVAPFKVGPDYIDPGFHTFVTGNTSHNLDSWLLSEDALRFLFRRNIEDDDIGVIEGVMGLYDGFGAEKDQGSTAHVSKILKAPVILVIDARAMASSAAAVALGFKLYDEGVPVKGIILNRVSGETHYQLLKTAIERDTKIPCIGYLPSNLDISLNSRHLGLIPAEEVDSLKEKTETLTQLIEEYIDIDALENIAASSPTLNCASNPCEEIKGAGAGLKIGIARDVAFSFYYDDNLKLLEEIGVELISFSPLYDKSIPDGVHGLYIGGGFPEVFACKLQDNIELRTSIKEHLENGLPAYAECGGLMYLTESIEDMDGNIYDMVGFLPTKSKMTKRLQRFGYVEVNTESGIEIRAHEFHRSIIEDNSELNYYYQVSKTRNNEIVDTWKEGLLKKNTLAGYPHVHFYSNLDFVMEFIERCKEYMHCNAILKEDEHEGK